MSSAYIVQILFQRTSSPQDGWIFKGIPAGYSTAFFPAIYAEALNSEIGSEFLQNTAYKKNQQFPLYLTGSASSDDVVFATAITNNIILYMTAIEDW